MIGSSHSNFTDYQCPEIRGTGCRYSVAMMETFTFANTYNNDIGVGPWTAIPGAILAIYDPPGGLLVTPRYRRVAISSLYGVDCEIVLTNTVIVTVLATVTPGSIDADQITCPDGDPAVFFPEEPAWVSSIPVGPCFVYEPR